MFRRVTGGNLAPDTREPFTVTVAHTYVAGLVADGSTRLGRTLDAIGRGAGDCSSSSRDERGAPLRETLRETTSNGVPRPGVGGPRRERSRLSRASLISGRRRRRQSERYAWEGRHCGKEEEDEREERESVTEEVEAVDRGRWYTEGRS